MGMKKITKVFSLTDFTKGKVKRLTLHIQDIPGMDKDKDGKLHEMGDVAIISGTLQKYNGSKDTVDNINFTYPLQSNAEFKRHILSIIKSALEADAKRTK